MRIFNELIHDVFELRTILPHDRLFMHSTCIRMVRNICWAAGAELERHTFNIIIIIVFIAIDILNICVCVCVQFHTPYAMGISDSQQQQH